MELPLISETGRISCYDVLACLLIGFQSFCDYWGISLAGSAIALSDKELHKKPAWYQESVAALENALKRLGKYRTIESITALDSAYDVLQRVEDCNNAEKVELIHKALEHFSRAFAHEPSRGIAGAHKWYALALMKLKEVDKKHKLVPKADATIVDHLQQACELGRKTPLLGIFLVSTTLRRRSMLMPINVSRRLRKLRHLSVANSFFVGESLHKLGQSEEAKNWLQKAVALPIMSDADGKARIKAKEVLSMAFKQQELPNENDF
uniref:Uncharacterized protein n=1 Tax=Ditylenchus dipsaci TaxID=166011 RepID=A0A915DX51_9BILA